MRSLKDPVARLESPTAFLSGCGLMLTIIDKFDGGPVGIDTLSSASGEERDTLEDVYEPYLIQEGFLQRTPRGRMATRTAYNHLQRPWEKEPTTPHIDTP